MGVRWSQGELDPDAKPLKGFGGAHVIEIVGRFSTDAYRAVYTCRFSDAVHVLHAFQRNRRRVSRRRSQTSI